MDGTRCDLFIWEDERAQVIAQTPGKIQPQKMVSTNPNKDSAPRTTTDCSDDETADEHSKPGNLLNMQNNC
jgi:hypothetical protein